MKVQHQVYNIRKPKRAKTPDSPPRFQRRLSISWQRMNLHRKFCSMAMGSKRFENTAASVQIHGGITRN